MTVVMATELPFQHPLSCADYMVSISLLTFLLYYMPVSRMFYRCQKRQTPFLWQVLIVSVALLVAGVPGYLQAIMQSTPLQTMTAAETGF